jgi:hypothetical protein
MVKVGSLLVFGVSLELLLPSWLPPRPATFICGLFVFGESPFQFSLMGYVTAVVSAVPNPALEAFVAQVATEFQFAEVMVRRVGDEFRLTHCRDRDASPLRPLARENLRDLAQFTAGGKFRPLRSAPNLQNGWEFTAQNASELQFALESLYPGSIADWFAVRQGTPPVTHYREFTARQTGMYRVTTLLTDDQVAHIARAGCHPRFCLKQRLWTVKGLEPDHVQQKSAIPCLEPCAVLLEFARTGARLEQQEKHMVALSASEWETCAIALERVATACRDDLREADFAAPDNPRRAQLLLEKIKPVLAKKEHEVE